MAVDVARVTEIIVEPALRRESHPRLGRAAARLLVLRARPLPVARPLQAPFPDRGGCITSLLQHGRERVVVLERLVELVVPHIGVSLRAPEENRRAGGRADRRAAVMIAQLHALRREAIELRRGECGNRTVTARRAFVLEGGTCVPESEVIAQDEDDVRLGGAQARHQPNESEEKTKVCHE